MAFGRHLLSLFRGLTRMYSRVDRAVLVRFGHQGPLALCISCIEPMQDLPRRLTCLPTPPTSQPPPLVPSHHRSFRSSIPDAPGRRMSAPGLRSASAAAVPRARDAAAVRQRAQVALWQPRPHLVADADPVVPQVVAARKHLEVAPCGARAKRPGVMAPDAAVLGAWGAAMLHPGAECLATLRAACAAPQMHKALPERRPPADAARATTAAASHV